MQCSRQSQIVILVSSYNPRWLSLQFLTLWMRLFLLLFAGCMSVRESFEKLYRPRYISEFLETAEHRTRCSMFMTNDGQIPNQILHSNLKLFNKCVNNLPNIVHQNSHESNQRHSSDESNIIALIQPGQTNNRPFRKHNMLLKS